jgi:hypothetical protein
MYIEYKLTINSNISNKTINIKNDVEYFYTGDIIIFETPQNLDCWFSIIPVLFLNVNHVGIVIKDSNNKLYILESEHSEHYCKYSNRIKNGVILLDLEERLKTFDCAYLLKTNLHKYIQYDELISFLNKYKNKEYMEDNINCITFVSLFLKELKLIHGKYINSNTIYLDYKYFLNKENYINDFNYDIYKIKM